VLPRGILLDRDGVLTACFIRSGKPSPPMKVSEVRILPLVLLIVVTNQPDVSRGILDLEEAENINRVVREKLPMLDDIFVCYHDTGDGCTCRKPEPGMLQAAAAKYNLDMRRSCMVGDRWKDITAGLRAGCRTVFIDRGHKEKIPTNQSYTCTNLMEATSWILREELKFYETQHQTVR
jgi:D-glycero-D-manno-heptose 1,7-bisphosphate phosphatase